MARTTMRDPTGKYPGRKITVVSNKVDAKTVVAVAYQAGFRGKNLETAVAVSFAENGAHDATAQNVNTDKSVDTGLWQINSVHGISIRDLFEPQRNANAAWAISSHGTNFSPWTTYPVLSAAQTVQAHAAIVDLERHGGAVEWLRNNPLGTPEDVHGSVDSPNLGSQLLSSTPLGQILDSTGSFISTVTDAHNWFRIGQGILGGLMLFFGLMYLIKGEIPSYG